MDFQAKSSIFRLPELHSGSPDLKIFLKIPRLRGELANQKLEKVASSKKFEAHIKKWLGHR